MNLQHMKPTPAELAAADQLAAQMIATPNQMSAIYDAWQARYPDIAQWRRIRFAVNLTLLQHLRDTLKARSADNARANNNRRPS